MATFFRLPAASARTIGFVAILLTLLLAAAAARAQHQQLRPFTVASEVSRTAAIQHDDPFLDAGVLTMRSGECEPEWVPTFAGTDGMNSVVETLIVFDDGSGSGPAVYAAGDYTDAGGVSADRIARWDGTAWSPLGTGMDANVLALAVFDDGSGFGPALYAGGNFTTAGGQTVNSIARWDGTTWSPLGTGMNDVVRTLTVFDDGSGGGPALYAGGDFTTAGGVSANRIARWDGTAWSPLGSGTTNSVYALTVFDDGSGGGPALYAGGTFTTAGGVTVNRIARWDGTSWSPLGSGFNSTVFALTVFDGALYAGGFFTSSGALTLNRVAKWDGGVWSPLGIGFDDASVRALAVYNDGSGAALYAGGFFTSSGGATVNRMAKWNGTSWSPLGTGMNGSVRALAVFNDGTGSALYAGGTFTTAGGKTVNRFAKWDGAGWAPLGTGMNSSVFAIVGFNNGTETALYPAGEFTTAGGLSAHYIARLRGCCLPSWIPTFGGANGVDNFVIALTVFDDGSGGGPALYAGGDFATAGGVSAINIAKWDGVAWSPLGSGMNGGVTCFAVFNDGTGDALYAGGLFTTAGGISANSIAKWDGVAWSSLGTGFPGLVTALAVFDDGSGPALYAASDFIPEKGPEKTGSTNISRWDGTTWSPLGSGFGAAIWALAVYDDGAGGGPALYAGGDFTTAGGVTATGIAKWDGTAWSPLGLGVIDWGAYALTVFDDGSGGGPALYASGGFVQAGGSPARYIARWDGSSWSPLGSGMNNNGEVFDLTVYNDGTGDALYATGVFSTAGGVSASRIAKWNGTAWSPLGAGLSGFNAFGYTLEVFDDGSGGGPSLYVGGLFTEAGGSPANSIAKWQGCFTEPPPPPPCPGDITGDGIVNLADFNILAVNFGAGPGATLAQGDLNADGFVNLADFNILAVNFGTDCN